MTTAIFFMFMTVLCFNLDDMVVTPDFDKNGNIIVHGLFRTIVSKLLLSLGFTSLFMAILEYLCFCFGITKN